MKVPAEVTRAVILVVCTRSVIGRALIKGTHDSGSQDKDGNDKDDDHEDVIESSDSTIKISHRCLETKTLSVDTEDGRFDLVSSGISVAIFVEHFKTNLSSLKIREADEQSA